jgi:hypothetical protein
MTKDPHAALTAQFARAALANAVPVDSRAVLAVEGRVIADVFNNKRRAYLRELARRGANREIARGVIADDLRRRAIAKRGDLVFDWIAARETSEASTAICVHDDLPGMGEALSVGNDRDVGSVPLASFLPFLFRDRTPPATPAAPSAVRAGQTVTLTWTGGREADLAGYDLFRTLAGGTPQRLNVLGLLGRTTFTDTASLTGASYSLRAVDTSGNASVLSPAVAT